MNRLLTSCEIFVANHRVCLLTVEGLSFLPDELIERLAAEIEADFPEAYNALAKHYADSRPNLSYYMRRIVTRFLKCNFSPIDNKPDIHNGSFCNFEFVPCPIRGECPHEGVVCGPQFKPSLRRAEIKVMQKWYEGLNEDEIAALLCLSPYTIHNHIRNAYARLGVHSRSEFVKYAVAHNIFP